LPMWIPASARGNQSDSRAGRRTWWGRRIPPTMSRILHLRYVDHSQLTAQDIPVHSYLGLFSHSRS
jgi:hypothetical protein